MLRLYQIFGMFCVALVFNYVYKECRGIKYRKLLISTLIVQVFFVAIGYFYLSMPVLTYLFIGGVGIPAVISGMMFDSNLLLIVATTYLPFSLLLPGLFGGLGKGINLTNMVIFALFISLFMSKNSHSGRVHNFSKGAMFLLGAFVVLAVMSYVKGSLYHGPHYLMALMIPFKRFLTPMIVFYLFYKLIGDRDIIKIIFSIIMLTVIINIFFGLLQWVFLGLGTYSTFKRRLIGINGHPNFYAAFLAYYTGFIAGPMLMDFRKNSGRFLLFPFLLGLRIIIPTNSRGGWLALAAALPTLSFFRSKLTFLLFVFLVALFLLFPALQPTTVRHRIAIAGTPGMPEAAIYTVPSPTTVLSESKAISIRTRWILLEAGWELAKENIWFGSGFRIYPFVIGNYNPDLERASPHNIWMEILCEMGLLALIAVLSMLAFFFKDAWYVFRREPDLMLRGVSLGFLASIPAIFFANLTGNRFDAEELMYIFWISGACILQLKNIIRTERLNPDMTTK